MLQFLLKKIHNRKGFTLIELVVVITILGILALIAVPRLGGFTSDAKDSAALATERTIKSAITMLEAKEGKDYATIADVTKLEPFLDGVSVADTAAAGVWGISADGKTITKPTDW